MAVFPFAGRDNLAAEVAGQKLHAVTNAEYRDTEIKDSLLDSRSPIVINRFGTAGKNNAFGAISFYGLKIHIKGMQFAIYMRLTDTPGYQLGVL